MKQALTILTSISTSSFTLGLMVAALAGQDSSTGGRPSPVLTSEQSEILGHFELLELEDGQGGLVKTIRITGVNVQIVNGLGATNGNLSDPGSLVSVSTNGLGNLILGYAEAGQRPVDRTGSHNLVLGTGNSYESFGGAVTGNTNRLEAPHASVLSASDSSATGERSIVLGGSFNIATADGAVSAGGFFNAATGVMSGVFGGTKCIARGDFSATVGGYRSLAAGDVSSVQGGANNQAMGSLSSVSGGNGRFASGLHDWAAGSLYEGN